MLENVFHDDGPVDGDVETPWHKNVAGNLVNLPAP